MTTPTLRITSERIVGSWPEPTGKDPRNQTAYCPAYYDNFFGVDILAYLGGWIDRPDQANTPIGSPDRFADKYRWATRLHGTLEWTDRGLMIGAAQFPWNLRPASEVPDAWRVGACGGGQFYAEGDTLFFDVSVTIDDVNNSTGEHDPTHTLKNGYGLVTPAGHWSYFAVFRFELKATGIDQTTMRLRAGEHVQGAGDNFALQRAHFFTTPNADGLSGQFKGFTNVRGVIPTTTQDGQALIFWSEFWRTTGGKPEWSPQTQVIIRESQGGALLEVWNGQAWEPFLGPGWLNDPDQITGTGPNDHWPKGDVAAYLMTHVAKTSYFPGFAFIGLSTDRQHITWSLTSDLTIGWQTQGTIAAMPGGVVTNRPQSAVDPHFAMVDGKPVLYVSVRVDGPQDTYAGLEVWECQLAADNLPAPPDPIHPPDPTPVTPRYPYTSPHPLPVPMADLTTANGYTIGDEWFTSSTIWSIFKGPGAFKFPPNDGGVWVFGGKVTL